MKQSDKVLEKVNYILGQALSDRDSIIAGKDHQVEVLQESVLHYKDEIEALRQSFIDLRDSVVTLKQRNGRQCDTIRSMREAFKQIELSLELSNVRVKSAEQEMLLIRTEKNHAEETKNIRECTYECPFCHRHNCPAFNAAKDIQEG